MKINNFMCEKCCNMEICNVFKTLKKFDENYARNPLCADITIDQCPRYTDYPSETN